MYLQPFALCPSPLPSWNVEATRRPSLDFFLLEKKLTLILVKPLWLGFCCIGSDAEGSTYVVC